jgi:hypothetical protein
VEHSWKNNVVYIIALAADETVIFNSSAARAHSANFDFV